MTNPAKNPKSDDPESVYLQTRERFNTQGAARKYLRRKNRADTFKNRRELECIRRALEGMAPGSLVLDLPCGSGRLEPFLAAQGYRVVAADYSRPMLATAQADYQRQAGYTGQATVRFEHQDVVNTTFPDDSFDAVICNRLLHHYPASDLRRQVLAELARICRGRLIVSFFSNFSLSAWRFHLSNYIRSRTPTDRIPIWFSRFREDCEACGLRVDGIYPVLFGISPQTYVCLLKADA